MQCICRSRSSHDEERAFQASRPFGKRAVIRVAFGRREISHFSRNLSESGCSASASREISREISRNSVESWERISVLFFEDGGPREAVGKTFLIF